MKKLLLQLNHRSLLIVALVFAFAATGWTGQKQSTMPAHHAHVRTHGKQNRHSPGSTIKSVVQAHRVPRHVHAKKNRRLPAARTYSISGSQKSSSVSSITRKYRTQSIGAITVNTTADEAAIDPTTSADASDGKVSLRSAIQYTNAMIGPDTVIVPAGTYTLTLTGSNEDTAATGDLDINTSLVIIGAGEGETIIDGKSVDRVFDINPVNTASIAVKISDLTITGGLTPSGHAGGGIQIYNNNGTAELDSVDVSHNVAGDGGGIFVGGSANVTVKYSTFTYDSTTVGGWGCGGAFYNNAGNFTFDSCTFKHNYGDEGGGAFDIEAGDNIISNCVIESNYSPNWDGAIEADGNRLTMTNDTVRWNQADYCGGIEMDNPFTMRGCVINYNTSGNQIGGLLIDSGPDTLSNVTFYGDTASNGNGGGVEIDNGTVELDSVDVSHNVAAIEGGGIYVGGSANITVKYSTFIGDSSMDYGGAFGNDYGNFTFDHCTFKHNYGYEEGAFYIGAGDNIISNCVIDSNYSPYDGGAIGAWGNSLTMTNDAVRWNQVDSGGFCGGIEMGNIFTMRGCVISYNASGSDVGGLCIESGPDTLSNVTINGNSASGNGGGIRIWSSPVYFSNVDVDSNSASGYGGGIDDEAGSLMWVGGSLSKNAASGGGGGLYFSGFENDTLSSVTIAANSPDNIYDNTGGAYQVFVFGEAFASARAATNVHVTAATVNGSVNPNGVSTTVRFLYGTVSGNYTDSVSASPPSINGTTVTSVSAALSGLAVGTTYYYRVSGTSSSPPNYFVSDEMNFGTYTAGNNALKFDGVNDYVEIPNNSALNPATFTYEFWARVDGGSGNYRAPLSCRYWDHTYMYGVNFYADATDTWALSWGSGTASTVWAGIEGQAVVTGEWTHLAATYDGTTMRFYINGVLQGDSVCAFSVNTVTPLRFGAVADSYGAYFNGELDEVRVWNVVRSQAEIQSTMNTFLTGTETGLVGYWQFNESGATTTAYDYLGHYDGTLHNFSFDGTTDGWVANLDLSLPVQATAFLAKSDIGSVTLSWKTQSEVNNAGFNVLREDPNTTVGSTSLTTGFKLISSYTSNDALKGLGTSSTGRAYDFTDNKVTSGKTYQYMIQSVSTNGTTSDLTTLSVTVDIPKNYALYQNYPNPFNPSTTIRFDLKQISDVTLEIYNTLGQRVEYWNFGMMDAGRYNENIDMTRFASGVYFYRVMVTGVNGEKFVSKKKMLEMK